MKIQFFGTAAYEGIPSLYCQCETCLKSLKLGGKNIRTRSQALINDDLLIDFNCDTLAHYQTYRFDFDKVRTCLITHSHEDHLYVSDILQCRGKDFSHPNDDYQINFYSGIRTYQILKEAFNQIDTQRYLKATYLKPNEEYMIAGYKIVPLIANHDFTSTPYIYYIEKDGKKMVYGNDSGVFFDDVIQTLKKYGTLDFINLDCTGGLARSEGIWWMDNHMCLESNIIFKNRLEKEGIIDKHTKVVATHFSHNGHGTHDELVEAAKESGIIIAYDGLVVEF